MYSIVKRFTFEASHALTHLDDKTHKCRRDHGHSYTVEVEARSRALDVNGFVHDFAEFDRFRSWLNSTCDHRNLNDVFGAEYTTAERLANEFYNRCHQLGLGYVVAVRVHETANTWAEYRPT